jgi:predicted ester cyclase
VSLFYINSSKGALRMSVQEENKVRQQRVWEELFNKKNLEIVDELFTPEWVEHMPTGDIHGLDGAKQGPAIFYKAFPDLHVTVDDMIAEEDKVVSRITMTGTFKGEYHGIAPTGKKFEAKGINIIKWVDGKEVEAWAILDILTFYRQLGIPIPE